MTGRGRSTRAGTRSESAAAVSPPRRATRSTPAAGDGNAMPPPPPPATRGGRATRSQSKDLEQPVVPDADSVPSFPTQIAEEADDDVTGLGEDAALAEQLQVSQPPLEGSGSLSIAQTGDDGASQFPDSQDPYSHSRRVASTPGRSDIFVTTPGGSRARARVLLRAMRHLPGYAYDVQELLYNHNDDAVWHLEYSKAYNYFSEVRDEFQRDGFFINANTVITSLDVDLDDPTAIHASRAVSMANLASLLADIHLTKREGLVSSTLLPFVQAWDDAFPSRFLPLREASQFPWVEQSEVIDLALGLRIQRTICTLEESEGDIELISLIDAIWVDPRGLSPRQELLAFLSGDNDHGVTKLNKPLADISMDDDESSELRNRYVDVVRQVYSVAAGGQLRSAITDLKERYPIEPLMKHLRKWSFGLFGEIFKVVDPTRGSTAPQQTPSVIASQIDSQDESRVDPMMYALPEARPAAYTSAELGDLQQLRSFDSQLDPSQSPAIPRYDSQSQQPRSPSVASITNSQIIANRKELVPSSAYPPPSTFPYQQSSPTPGQQDNGLHLAQSAAVAASSAFAAQSSSATALGKRPRATQDDDDSFETDNRQLNTQGDAAVAETPRPKKRARTKRLAVESVTPGFNGEGSQTPRRTPSASAMEPDLEALSQKSRLIALENRRPKPPQTRTPWSRNDCRLLIHAVWEHSAKWSLIQKKIESGEIQFEHPRDQQALRDKARLLKQDFLKTDTLLPPGFDFVMLGKKEREAVIAAGRNPDRKEDDVDENENPTNTLYGVLQQQEQPEQLE